MKRALAFGLAVVWLGVPGVGLGCRTGPSSLGRVEPGWRVRDGQAVWRPLNSGDCSSNLYFDGPSDSLYVGVDGDVRFCCLIEQSLGNLRNATAEQLWNGWRARRLRRMVGRGNWRFCGPYCRPKPRSP